MEKLRWGILGVARINRQLLPAFAKASNAEVTAIGSRSLDKAQAAAADANIPKAYGSYEELLDDPEIDAIYNPLPNTLHAEWTMKAAERGKHVLCEKPLTPTASEAKEVVDFCRTKGITLMDGFMWPHHPRTAKVRQFLDSGEIGPVRRVTSVFTFRMHPLDPNNIRLKPETAGGSLLDVGCYPIYAIRWAFNAEPVRVQAWAKYEFGVDIEMNGVLSFEDGRVASFDCGFVHPYRGWIEIACETAVVTIPDLWHAAPRAVYQIRRGGQSKDVEEVALEGEDQIEHMVQNFSHAVLEKKPMQPTPTEAVKTLRVLDALALSAKEGKPVDVVVD